MRYINLIWDFDGMLFDTYPRMASAFVKALSDMGIRGDYDEVMLHIKRSVGKATNAFSEKYGLDRQRLIELYHLHEHAMPPETMVPYEGMCELLKDAVTSGKRHFLYTHRDDSALEALDRYGIRPLFSGGVTAMDHFPAKPAPDALLHIMERYSLDPDGSIMLGDRDIDILAARNAGISGCLFDPAHFYDAFDNGMRTDTVDGLRDILDI